MRIAHIKEAIQSAYRVADVLENRCPADQSDTPAEDAAHALIHALRDAANEADRALGDLPDAAGLRHGRPKGLLEPKLVPGKSRRIPRKS